MRYHLVMPAAGSGRRFSADMPKQYAVLRTSTVIEHSLASFESDADCLGIVLVLARDDAAGAAIASRCARPVILATGGEERVHSVLAGLMALRDRVRDEDWIMVHDAARPCLTPGDLAALKRALESDAVGGLLAIPLADTLKRGLSDSAAPPRVDATLDRSGLWRAATPQVFRYGILKDALDRALAAQRIPTDESQAVEWAGHRSRLIAGRADNIKVTTVDDLALASAILHARAES